MAKCDHHRAKFYDIQWYGPHKKVRLYNCPDCGSTVSEKSVLAGKKRWRKSQLETEDPTQNTG